MMLFTWNLLKALTIHENNLTRIIIKPKVTDIVFEMKDKHVKRKYDKDYFPVKRDQSPCWVIMGKKN